MNNTIEEIEQSFWGDPPENSTNVITKCYNLRKKKLNEFSVDDFRFLIGQNRALEILIPKALILLNKDIFVEGDFYEGDLLENVLKSEKAFWKNHPEMKRNIIELFEINYHRLEILDIPEEIKEELKKAYNGFKAD
jgi:hypothetical protein